MAQQRPGPDRSYLSGLVQDRLAAVSLSRSRQELRYRLGCLHHRERLIPIQYFADQNGSPGMVLSRHCPSETQPCGERSQQRIDEPDEPAQTGV